MRACKVLVHDNGKVDVGKVAVAELKSAVSNAGSEIGGAAIKIKNLPKAAGKMVGAYVGTRATGAMRKA